MVIGAVLLLSTALQLLTCILAVRWVRVPGARLAWGLVAAGMLLMLLRRGFLLLRFLGSATPAFAPDATSEWIGLAISACMAAGVVGIGPVFRARLKIAEALIQSEERFRLLVDSVQDYAIYRLDREGHVTSWNAGAERIKGYQAAEILGRHFSCFYTPEDIAAGKPAAELQIAAAEGHFEHEGWRLRKDGSRLWANVLISAIRDENGRLTGFAKVTRDITQRRNVEKTLRLNEARLHALAQLNLMSEASLKEITDFTLEAAVALTESKIGYLAFLNDDESVLTMHSWSKDAMQLCAISDKPLVYPVAGTGLWGEAVRQRQPVITNDYAAPSPLKKGYPAGHVRVLRHMNAPVFDGSHIVIVAGVGNKEGPYDDGDVRQLTLLMQGMWQLLGRRRARERLNHLNAVLRAVRNVNQLICREKSPARLLEGACRLMVEARGYHQTWGLLRDGAEEELIVAESGVGPAWDAFATRLRRGEFPPCVRNCLDRQPLVITEQCVCDEALCPLADLHRDADAVAVRVAHGDQVYGVLGVTLPAGLANDPEEKGLLEEVAGDVAFALHGIGMDAQRAHAEAEVRLARDQLESRVAERTAELQRANVELERAKRAAEAASHAKSTFLANMSHEIRTPLNAVIGMTELVLKSGLSVQQREYLMTVRDAGEALLSVINDVLDFSKIEVGKLVLERTSFDLRENLGDTMKSFSLRACQRGLELTCFIHPDVPHLLQGDYNRLRQIVVNLVGNALKFTERGEVSVEVCQEWRGTEDVVLHFTVRDTGIGVPADKLATIFEMFEQADSSSTRRHGGTGLGLAIAARLAALMGGRIWLESEVDRGSRFHFLVRLGLENATAHETPTPLPARLRGLRTLVVDDNATNRHILVETLRAWEMTPDDAEHAADALAALRRAASVGQPERLVITDAHMPQVDGFALAAEIKQDPLLKDTVLVVLTSGDRPEDIARCKELGIASYLLKPVKQSELLEAIQLAMGIAAQREKPVLPPAPHLADLQVLLAEDSLVNQKLAAALLEQQGHMVTVVSNGKDAVAATAAGRFDLVLMDVQMPEMDGLEAVAQIRARERSSGAHLPIIAMTAHALKGDRQRCLAAGMDGYVAKPIRAEELLATIDSLVTRQRSPAAKDAATVADAVNWGDSLKAMRGDRQLLNAVVEATLVELPRLVSNLAAAARGGDLAAARLAAHTLRGSLGYFGVPGLVQAVGEVERCIAAGDSSQVAALVPPLETRITRLLDSLSQHLGDGKVGP
jgi:two-component system, sensor histidine kinase and response regulator